MTSDIDNAMSILGFRLRHHRLKWLSTGAHLYLLSVNVRTFITTWIFMTWDAIVIHAKTKKIVDYKKVGFFFFALVRHTNARGLRTKGVERE